MEAEVSTFNLASPWLCNFKLRRAQEAGGGGRRLARERGDDRACQQEEPLCRDVPPQQGERSCRVDIYPLIHRVEFLHFDIDIDFRKVAMANGSTQ